MPVTHGSSHRGRRSARAAAAVLALVVALVASVGLSIPGAALGGAPGARLREATPRVVQLLEAGRIGVARPMGIVYDTRQQSLAVLDRGTSGQAQIRYVAASGAMSGGRSLGRAADGRLFGYDTSAGHVVASEPGGSLLILPSAGAAAAVSADSLPTAASGIAVDPRDGSWVVLEGAQLHRRASLAAGSAESLVATLGGVAEDRLIGPAVAPDGTIFVLDADAALLHEVAPDGAARESRDVSGAQLRDPRGIALAPSADPTDGPSVTNLFVADAGSLQGSGAGVVELELTSAALSPQLQALAATPATVIRTIDTSAWATPSTDPGAIAYASWLDQLIVTDSEIEEAPAPWWNGANGFIASRTGTLAGTFDLTRFNQREPAGVTVDPGSKLMYSSDDSNDKVFVIDPGSDGVYNGNDTLVRSFSLVHACASGGTPCVIDPEGLGFGNGHLFISDGTGKEIWELAPGSNGHFDGTPGDGGDDVVVNHFDTEVIGHKNPEGVDFSSDGTLWIVSNTVSNQLLSQVTTAGSVLQEIDLKGIFGISHPGEVAIAPRSNGSGWSAYVADRGIDNAADQNENDGKIFEVAVTLGGPSPTPTPTASASATPTPSAAPRSVVRAAGADRYGTAANVSQIHWPSPGAGIAAAYVASGEAFPDALAGAPAADRRGGPMLLVRRNDIPGATSAELTRLKPNVIYLLGGPAIVSTAVETQLAAYARSHSVIRLGGTDRYETAVDVVGNAFPAGVSDVMVATGQGFADALAGGAAASRANMPILLVRSNDIPDSTAAKLSSLGPNRIWVLGGPASISTAVEAQLHGYAGTVTRLAGDDRYETAIHISKQFFNAASGDHLWVATGALFPDALSAGATGDPVLLTRQAHLPTGALPAPLEAVSPEIGRLDPSLTHVLGGSAVVSDAVLNEIRAVP